MQRPVNACNKGAFTLIELLVVIAVISLLAALVMPVLEQAFRQADMASCKNNLKQIGNSLMMYTSQWKGKYPPTDVGCKYTASRSGGKKANLGILCPDYIADGRSFYCPSLKGPIGHYDTPAWGFAGNFPNGNCSINYIYAADLGNTVCMRRPQPSMRAIASDQVICYNSTEWGSGHHMHITGYNVLRADNSVYFYQDHDESIAWNPPYSGSQSRLVEIWNAFSTNTPDRH